MHDKIVGVTSKLPFLYYWICASGFTFLTEWIMFWLLFSYLFWIGRGWCPKFATGLDIINRHSPKVIKVIKLSFCKMILKWEDHFGKRTVWSLLYFLNYDYLWYLAQSQILGITLSTYMNIRRYFYLHMWHVRKF